MSPLPALIHSVEELDELLSRPSDAVVDFVREVPGDMMILGAGGKIGPTMARMVRRAVEASGTRKKVVAVDVVAMPGLEAQGIQTMACDLLDLSAVERLPQVENVIFMAGRKFGSTGSEHMTWAMNVIVPYHVARTFTRSRIVAFSTGCVYPVMHLRTGGATEETPADPVGEYAMSCLGRERMFDYVSRVAGEKVVLARLNYAVELRYGVLFDIGSKVWSGTPVDVTTGYANVIWQGDACAQIIRCLGLASSPPRIVNMTGPETFSVRQVAKRFAQILGKEALFTGEENQMGYLNNALEGSRLFGYPEVPLGRVIEWTAHWIRTGGKSLGKPTHFETQDGKY